MCYLTFKSWNLLFCSLPYSCLLLPGKLDHALLLCYLFSLTNVYILWQVKEGKNGWTLKHLSCNSAGSNIPIPSFFPYILFSLELGSSITCYYVFTSRAVMFQWDVFFPFSFLHPFMSLPFPVAVFLCLPLLLHWRLVLIL